MCGITGVVSSERVDPVAVCRMRDSLQHRGPDHAGIWSSSDGHVCLGHRRLAILDLSEEANQPFVSTDGRFVISFNGEIYNFQSLRRELTALGARFRTRSCDTEVLLEAFRQWGEHCLEKLSGMFAFAIWDNETRRLFCARDRAGEKPFYYAIAGRHFLFGSELKALAVGPGFRNEIHYPALADYLCLGFVPDPKTIWEGCLKLAPAHFLWVDLPPGGVPTAGTPAAYWDMEFDPDFAETGWEQRIRDTLQTAAQEMAFADVPVGTFLSGGVDSSSITAALSRQGSSVQTFTVGFQESAYDERPWAAEVAQLYGTVHTSRTVVPDDVKAVFDRMLWHYDEPFNDYSYVPTFYVCREARKTIKVALSGDGGDEVFAGYSKYRRLALRQQAASLLTEPWLTTLASGLSRCLPRESSVRRKIAGYRLDLPHVLLETLTTAFSIEEIRTAARGPLAETLKHGSPRDTILSLLRRAPPEKVGLINAMRYLDLKLTLGGDMLVKVDRASMAVALEVRPVYLHRDMLALAARIPPHLLADRHQSKKLLKSALRPWLPDSILYRRKMGFAMPLQQWAGGDLQSMFSASRKNDPLEDFLDPSQLSQIAQAHAQGNGGSALLVHNLFFLRNWLEQWAGASHEV